MHVSHAQKWRLDPQTPPTSLHLGRHDRETKELLLLVCCGSNPLTWMCKYATWFVPCGACVIHEHTRAHVQPPLFPSPCWHTMQRPRPRASFRLFSSLRAISNNLPWWYGTEAGRHVTCSASAWWQTSPLFMPGEEKGPQCTTAAFGCLCSGCTRPAVEPRTVDRRCFVWACDHAAQATWFILKNLKKGENDHHCLLHHRAGALVEFSQLDASRCLLFCCLWCSYFVSFLLFQDAK